MYQINLEKETYSLGTSLTIEALKSIPSSVLKVFLSSKAYKNNQLNLLIDLCDKNHIEIVEDDEFINKYSLKENCYCIGLIKRFNLDLIDDNHIVLCGINDIGQLGTVFRSAVSFNFKNIILINSKIDVFDPRVVRASMGAIFHIHIKKYSSLKDYLKDYNYHLYLYNEKSLRELKDVEIVKPYSILINEDKCLDDEYIYEDFYLKHNKEISPSISAVSSIVFHHFYKNLFR